MLDSRTGRTLLFAWKFLVKMAATESPVLRRNLSWIVNMLGDKQRFRVAILVLILPLIPITFFDLKVSQLVADKANVVGKFVAEYGEFPAYILICFALLFVIAVSPSVKEKIVYGVFLFFLVLILAADSLDDANAIVSGLILMFVPVLFILISLRLKMKQKVLQFSRITALLALISPLIMVQTLKWLWGRTRFRNLSTDYSEFTVWFLPQGSNGHRSFPSGHAAMGWMLLPLLLLAASNRQRLVISTVVIFWGVFVSAGRVIAGSHYVSDVYAATLIGLWTFIMLTRRLVLIDET